MVVKGARVVLENEVAEVDVRIEEGRIVEIGTELGGEALVAKGRYLLPALADVGVKMRDGRLRGGTLERLAKKARASGFGTLAISSLCMPRVDDEITLEFAKSQAERCRDARIVPLLSGVNEEGGLSDCAILLREGAVGIEFESHIDGNLIRRLMEYAKLRGVRLFCRPNDPALQGEGVMHEGRVSGTLGLAGVPPLAEISQVARIGEFARAYEVPTVMLGASTPETLDLCSQNPYLQAQVSLHHLLLDDTACEGYDTSAKIWPPLRDARSREEMLQRALEGAVEMLTTLHSPVSPTAKDSVFAEAAYGIEGLSHFLPLAYTELVKRRGLGWSYLVRMSAAAPLEACGLRGGRIAVGERADLVLFDPSPKRRLDAPYGDREVEGVVEPL
ncbi:hypothetical protein [Hydrogenimonas sp.]